MSDDEIPSADEVSIPSSVDPDAPPNSGRGAAEESVELSHEEARERLLDAVDAIYDVQEGYEGLTPEGDEMLRDAKSSIAAVHFHADENEVRFDLDL